MAKTYYVTTKTLQTMRGRYEPYFSAHIPFSSAERGKVLEDLKSVGLIPAKRGATFFAQGPNAGTVKAMLYGIKPQFVKTYKTSDNHTQEVADLEAIEQHFISLGYQTVSTRHVSNWQPKIEVVLGCGKAMKQTPQSGDIHHVAYMAAREMVETGASAGKVVPRVLDWIKTQEKVELDFSDEELLNTLYDTVGRLIVEYKEQNERKQQMRSIWIAEVKTEYGRAWEVTLRPTHRKFDAGDMGTEVLVFSDAKEAAQHIIAIKQARKGSGVISTTAYTELLEAAVAEE